MILTEADKYLLKMIEDAAIEDAKFKPGKYTQPPTILERLTGWLFT